MGRVRLDLNHEEFQADLFALEHDDLVAVHATLRKIRQLDWNEFYRDGGLRWEAIQAQTHARAGAAGKRVYSLRITRKVRAVAYRQGDFLCLIAIHPDHDSAYKK